LLPRKGREAIACGVDELRDVPFAFRDIPGDFRGGDDFTLLVFDRRNGEGNVYEAAVLAASNCLIVIDVFASADPFEDKGFAASAMSETFCRLSKRC